MFCRVVCVLLSCVCFVELYKLRDLLLLALILESQLRLAYVTLHCSELWHIGLSEKVKSWFKPEALDAPVGAKNVNG